MRQVMALQHLLLLASSVSAFVPPGRHSIGRVALPHAIDASTLSDSMLALARAVPPPHAVVASVLSDSTLALASFQDFRDGIADVVRPFAILAAVPAFGIALIPVTLAAALARAAPCQRAAARDSSSARRGCAPISSAETDVEFEQRLFLCSPRRKRCYRHPNLLVPAMPSS